MTEAMPFLQKAILLSYAPRSFAGALVFMANRKPRRLLHGAGVFC